MKKLKKMVAVLLTAIMAMAMSVSVFASTQTGTLKVKVNDKNTLENQTIKVYKLFDLSRSGENYAYTVNSEYEDILKTVLNISKENPTSDDYYSALSKKTDTKEIQSFANEFTKAAVKANKAETAKKANITKGTTEVSFDKLDYGYYLVYQTGTKEIQSSLVSLDAAEKEVDLKGTAPSIEKTADKTSVNIGDTVTYTITGTIPDTTGYDEYQYIIKDTLSNGLTFDGNTTVAITDSTGNPSEAPGATIEGQNMTLDLSAWVRSNQENKGKTFTVTYKAKVNENAVVTENNKATLTYGNDPSSTTTTTPNEVKTPTYPLQIKKVDSANTDKLLAGAKFKLYKNKDDADAVNDKAIKVNKKADGKYVVDPAGITTEIVSVSNQLDDINTGCNLYLNGLEAGTYYLVETEAPDGYNKVSGTIEVTITKSTTTNVSEWTLTAQGAEGQVLTVQNSTGTILPSTGGAGTIIFSIVAGVLILGVAASFIKDRRKEA
ncbi:isopeptide-forming domain-containing fimbrial protein [Lachnospiraceae bacterium AM26-1LB]|nr:isopeptide-forming domain-containing fimbrial protein [Lachnospiraceae bacterium AM26-1LB]